MADSNAFMVKLLNSRIGRMTRGTTVVLRYVGPKSGKTVEFPVWAARDDDTWIVAVGMPDKKKWFKAFTHPLAATITVKGESHEVTGHIATDDEIDIARERYLRGVRAARHTLKGNEPIVIFTPTENAS